MENHSLLYLFADDLFHQILFYFGGVVGLLILLWEKFTERPINWRWIAAFFLFCVFVSCFQAWIDEHHNSAVLIETKARLTSDRNALQAKLEAKQTEVDWLRDHQQPASQLDPRITTILSRLNAQTESLRSAPGKALKKGLTALAKDMFEFFQQQKAKVDQVEAANFQFPAAGTDPAQAQVQWAHRQEMLTSAWLQMDGTIGNAMAGTFGPRAVVLLEQVRDRGEAKSGIPEKDVKDAIDLCSVPRGASYWGMQYCAEKIAVIAQKIH